VQEKETRWRFFGHERCDHCVETARVLLDDLRGLPVTLRMLSLDGPGPDHAPLLMDEADRVIWQRDYDAEATRAALRRAQVQPPRIPQEPY